MQSTDSATTGHGTSTPKDAKADLIHFLIESGFHWEEQSLVRTGVGSVPIPSGPVTAATFRFQKKRIARALDRGRSLGIEAPLSKETAEKAADIMRTVPRAAEDALRRTAAMMTEVPASAIHRGRNHATHRA